MAVPAAGKFATGKARGDLPTVRALDRAFELLELLAANGGESSLSELTESSGLPLPTTHRVVRAMMANGYVRQLQTKRYTLGPRLIGLGEVATQKLGACADPHLRNLVDQCGETSSMAMLDGTSVSYIAQAESSHAMRLSLQVGSRVGLHSTAVGKAILASLPRSQVHQLIDRAGLPKLTEATITDKDVLDEELNRTRERGFAIDDGEFEVGLRCIGVQVQDAPAPMAISVSAPSARLPESLTDQIVKLLKAAAEELLLCT